MSEVARLGRRRWALLLRRGAVMARPELRLSIEVLAALVRVTASDALASYHMPSQSTAMVTRLPHSDKAILDIRKIEDYCLNPSHPRGRHKARVFREALDLQRSDASWLREVLLEAGRSGDAVKIGEDAWGGF